MSGSNLPDPFLSSSNSILLEFSSDVSVTRSGFQLRYNIQETISSGMSLYIMVVVRGKLMKMIYDNYRTDSINDMASTSGSGGVGFKFPIRLNFPHFTNDSRALTT